MVLSDVNGKILDCRSVIDNGNTYILATGFMVRNEGLLYTIPSNAGATANNADGISLAGTSFLVEDYDVMVGIFPISKIGGGLASTDFKYYSSTLFDPPGYTNPNASNPIVIWQDFPCSTQYGPFTPERNAANQFWGGTVNAAPVIDNFFKHISKDEGRNIVYSNGYVYVSAEMRTLEMTGDIYTNLHRNNEKGVVLHDLNCSDPVREYDAYKDGYIFLMRFDLATGILLGYKNVAHSSGGDYYVREAIPNCQIVDPCPNPPYCNQLMGLYTSSGNSLPYRNDLLNAYVRMLPSAVADSLYLPGTTRSISLLASRNQQEDKRILAATYASLGNYTTAQQYLQQVTGADTETQDFVAYYTALINAGLAGRDAYHLSASEFAQLAPLMTHNASVSENVKTLDHILNGVYHPLEAETGTGNRPIGRSEEPKDVSLSGFTVYPNPFSDEVNFIAPNGVFITALTITDISGKVVFERKYASNEQYAIWQASGIAEGILFYQCRISSGKIVHGKLIYGKKK